MPSHYDAPTLIRGAVAGAVGIQGGRAGRILHRVRDHGDRIQHGVLRTRLD